MPKLLKPMSLRKKKGEKERKCFVENG